MRLEDLVTTSSAVTQVSGRLEKIDRLAGLLRRAAPDEIAIAIAYLSGRLPQGRIGIGGSLVWQAKPDTAAESATLQRFGRKLDVDRLRRELPLTPFFFDALDLDGEPLIDEPQARRFDALARIVPSPLIVPHIVAADDERAEAFLNENEATRHGHEGVMAKSRDAVYAAGSRGSAWLKVKPARTLDLVVLAVEWGNGRRRGWLSNLHLGARDTERGGPSPQRGDPGVPNVAAALRWSGAGVPGFVMLGKTFKGLTDRTLAWQTEKLLQLEIGRDDYTVYVRPELVVEVAFNDLQVSSQYPGGLALRFARVKRYRPEKPASEADTFATVQRIYQEMTLLEPPPLR
jgi:DNA ligase-1